MKHRKIELLAPAKTSTIGIAAINHGADAVYIGGPKFGARAAAGNNIGDILKLIDHAHHFHARVYVTLNTLLNDDELQEAQDLIHTLYEIGADALIIQDMGLLECDLPPIALHASTQTDNRTPEKVRFLQDVGFSQVVLARELSLQEIIEIRAASSVSLEFFVHGALCVSYSGRCRFSEIMRGRSANRGRCAQFCRHSYTLLDGTGAILQDNSYLLSLQDLDLSAHLQVLLAAGIDSFKIEGRLKDIDYVKNITAYYRRALDVIIDQDEALVRSSSGRCTFSFTPDPERTFHRGGCNAFLFGKRNRIGALASPKSTGKVIGKVVSAREDSFAIEASEPINNGDGLCFLDGNDRLVGFRVNSVQGNTIFPRDRLTLKPGTLLSRNFDIAFQRLLQKSSNCRKLQIVMTLCLDATGMGVEIVDEDGCRSFQDRTVSKEEAKDAEGMKQILIRQMKKCGGTIFSVQKVTIDGNRIPYFPLSAINDIRRRAFEGHLKVRSQQHVIEKRLPGIASAGLPPPPPPSEHIVNRKAAAFFVRHGAQESSCTAEKSEDRILMMCSYCLKAELGFCRSVNQQAQSPTEPLAIRDKTGTYELTFDCKRCEMQVLKNSNRKKPLD